MENQTYTEENISKSNLSSLSIYYKDEQPRKSILKNGPDSPQKKRMTTSNNARVSFNLTDQVVLPNNISKNFEDDDCLNKCKTSNNTRTTSKKTSLEYLPDGSTPSIMKYINEKIYQKEKIIKKTVTDSDILNSIFKNKISEKNDEENSEQSNTNKKKIKSTIFNKNSTSNSTSTINSYNTEFHINIYKINQGNSEIFNKAKETNSSILCTINEDDFQEYKRKLNDTNFYLHLDGRKFGLINGYSANSFRNIQNVNQNKLNISVDLNLRLNLKSSKIPKFENLENRSISFFSIFDGHGGESVSQELRENFKSLLLDDTNFFTDTQEALYRTFQKLEDRIILRNIKKSKENLVDKGGSSALILLIIDDICHIANLGDSRAILSSSFGSMIHSISIDHKPNYKSEKQRIQANGGFVFESNKTDTSSGLHRVSPGKLSVSRSIGDVESKFEYLGGLPGVIVPVPDIFSLKIQKDTDFIIMGSDGLFDKLSNKEITFLVFQTLKDCIESNLKYKDTLVKITNKLIIEAVERGSKDNITCIVLFFDNLYLKFKNKNLEEIKETIKNLIYSSEENNDLYENFITKKLFEDSINTEKLKTSECKYSVINSPNIKSSDNLKINNNNNYNNKNKNNFMNPDIEHKEKYNKKKSGCSCACNIF